MKEIAELRAIVVTEAGGECSPQTGEPADHELVETFLGLGGRDLTDDCTGIGLEIIPFDLQGANRHAGSDDMPTLV